MIHLHKTLDWIEGAKNKKLKTEKGVALDVAKIYFTVPLVFKKT